MSLYSNDDPISLELPVFSSNREAVIENNLVIPIPDGFHFTQDPAIIGPERALVVVPDSYPLTAPASDAPFALSVQSSPPDNSNDFKLRFMPNAADAMVNLLISPMLDPSIMTFRTGIRDGFGVFFQSFVDTGYHYNKVLAFIAADHKLYIAHLFWNNGSERCRERAFVDVFLTAATAWMEEFHLVGEPRGRKPLSAPQQNQPFFQTADPDNGLYPYYEQKRRENTLQLPGGRINFVFVHGSTEDYQLVSFRAKAAQEDTDPEFAKICRKIGQADVERYPLYETAEKWSRLFHVRASAFDPQRDREGELHQGLMRNAYMLHALRSFAWTLGAYCRRNLVTPEMVEQETLLALIDYAAAREWLNYNSAFFCPTLCGCSDLHTMYVSEAVISEAEKQFLPSQEELEREKKIRESFPTYTPTHSEVRSLDKLRNELSYIEPAIRSLYEKLSAERNFDNELSGNAADILYAWCALAIAAKESFYIEQGEGNYTFTHTSDKQFLNASPKSRKNTAKSASKKSAAPAEGGRIAQAKAAASVMAEQVGETMPKLPPISPAEDEEFVYHELPRNLRSIGECAFQECSELEYFDLPPNLKAIGAHAFDGVATGGAANCTAWEIHVPDNMDLGMIPAAFKSIGSTPPPKVVFLVEPGSKAAKWFCSQSELHYRIVSEETYPSTRHSAPPIMKRSEPIYPEDHDNISALASNPNLNSYGAEMLSINQTAASADNYQQLKALCKKAGELTEAIVKQEQIIRENRGFFGGKRKRRAEAKEALAGLQKEQAEVSQKIKNLESAQSQYE